MGRRAATSEIIRVMLPSGDLIWVRAQAGQAAPIDEAFGRADVLPGPRIAPTTEALRLPDFTQTIRGVVTSVRQALDEHRPDSLTVEFGIDIVAKAGAVLSVLAEVGANAHVTVAASWDRCNIAAPPPAGQEVDVS